jgi:hypothetical protein
VNKKLMIWFVGGWLLAIVLPPQRVVAMFKKSA